MDDRTLSAYVLMAVMAAALAAFLLFWTSGGANRSPTPGWKRVRRWWRARRR